MDIDVDMDVNSDMTVSVLNWGHTKREICLSLNKVGSSDCSTAGALVGGMGCPCNKSPPYGVHIRAPDFWRIPYEVGVVG